VNGLATGEASILFLERASPRYEVAIIALFAVGFAFALPPLLSWIRGMAARRELSHLGALVLAPLVVFGPFLLAGYTLSQNVVANDYSKPYGGLGVVAVADPAGSALMGEPYLVYLKRSLAAGRLPLLNMKNGLGAMGVESLLNGTFYVLNPVLFLLPTHKPLYFDLFTLLHVYVLLLGFYYFLRHYVSEFAAAGTSILVGLSGVTYAWANMEHYRSFAWLPMMMGAAVAIARDDRPRRSVAIFAFALIAACTAGNIQEFGIDLAATCVVFLVEFASRTPRRWSAALIFGGVLLAGLLMSAVAFLPYFASLSDGNVWATNESARSVRHLDPAWLFNWLMPRVIGVYPYLFLRDAPYWLHSDLSTVAVFFMVLGVIHGIRNRSQFLRAPDVTACLVLPFVMAAGLVKVVHFPFLDFVRHIPFAQQFFFAKYYLYVFALASVPIAIGLDRLPALLGERRTVVKGGVAVILVLLMFMVACLWIRPDYALAGIPWEIRRRLYIMNFAVSLGAFAVTAVLIHRRPRNWRGLSLCVFVLQSLALLPAGLGTRAAEYPVRYEAEAKGGERVLIRETASTNLFFDVESIALFDAVVNRYYRDFINGFFAVTNPQAIYQPSEKTLDRAQARALQLLGTSRVYGYEVEAGGPARREGDAYSIENPLPRVFVLSADTYASLRDVKLSKENIDSVVSKLVEDIRRTQQPFDLSVEGESISFSTPATGAGAVLVVNQAYSTNWLYQARPSKRLLELWPSWPLQAGTTQQVTYWPRGLTLGLAAMPVGFVLFLIVYFLSAKTLRADVRGDRPAGLRGRGTA
jgi:hypothetical protein